MAGDQISVRPLQLVSAARLRNCIDDQFNSLRRHSRFRDEDYALLRDLKSPVTLWGRPKHFLSDGWFPGRTVQVQEIGKPYEISIYIGEDLETCRRENISLGTRMQVRAGRVVGELRQRVHTPPAFVAELCLLRSGIVILFDHVPISIR